MATPTAKLVRQLALVLLVATGTLQTIAHSQTRDGAARSKPCAWLTAEIVKKVSVANHKSGALPAPAELPLPTGIACEWGDVLLQIDPFPPAKIEKLRLTDAKNWETVSGVGDAAYFHNVKDAAAELYVRVGARTFVIMIIIPVGTTAAAFKPNFIAVANQIVPKLR
jgi:hypothetical protein